ncbi:nitroreductase [Deinobacterium chartae]|uniref:Nitroreductase n=1 Tax=Deinobacterium chartae TaxID=521158 RepID=A0A841HY06_9DEIO|nr:nitroreductase family protein [Deinobacterium chartae]MBB6098277.1 nitroreductase [Deinobacterium chartae]
MTLEEAILNRRTTNGPFRPDPVRPEHQRRLMEAAAHAPSHFNSQPWRFVLIERRETIARIARIAGASMTRLIEGGIFFERYRRYFRFSQEEMDARRDGIFIDHLPAPLRPFTRQIFSDAGLALMRRLGVPARLGRDNEALVRSSPLLMAVLLDRAEYRPQQLSGFYSVFGMGAAMENIWLTVGELGMGIQFVSTPMEIPEYWAEIQALLEVPEDLELMAVYRLGYLPEEQRRPSIDWSSRERKRLSQYVFRETCCTPESDTLAEPTR